ncbi:hypothetical protein UYO_1574 [Lachnospiraceae bacterium JC7]|nr:hypothetical protein UYO_1574 [Lachnospiraceae bacterium JC7]
MENTKNTTTIKSDLPFYYGAAAILLIMACVCIILIFQNVFSGNAGGDSVLKRKTQVENVQNISETEELKISHAGLAGSDEDKTEVNTDDSNPVFRSKT